MPLTNCTHLRLLYLSSNDFDVQIPQEISSLTAILRLDLSDNNIPGTIPVQVANLTRLLTLRLQNNELSGPVPDLSNSLLDLRELNLSNNQLYGRLSDGLLKRFGERSFVGNEGLCGQSPLPVCSFNGNVPPAETVPSNPSSLPGLGPGPELSPPPRPKKGGLSTGAIVGIVLGNCVAMLVVTSFLVAYCCRGGDRSSRSSDKRSGGSGYGSEKQRVYANGNDSDGTTATDRSKLVFYERKKQFELEDLLRASAEMLGKGSLGTVYKAVLDDGSVVAVKRLKDANPCARTEFEQYMDVIGKLKHPNVVKLTAYYYAKEEKLLVYDYLPNGSLHSLIHGNGISNLVLASNCIDCVNAVVFR